ncbi:MAG: hypothetical protein Q9226_008195 [Calogaya cf. arnoldii]
MTRDSSEASFLRRGLAYPNYIVYQSTLAKRILFNGNKTATEVLVDTQGLQYTLHATKKSSSTPASSALHNFSSSLVSAPPQLSTNTTSPSSLPFPASARTCKTTSTSANATGSTPLPSPPFLTPSSPPKQPSNTTPTPQASLEIPPAMF